jgi:hypothetical protein
MNRDAPSALSESNKPRQVNHALFFFLSSAERRAAPSHDKPRRATSRGAPSRAVETYHLEAPPRRGGAAAAVNW